MKDRYKTVYEPSHGIATVKFKEKMTFEEAVVKGKKFCVAANSKYLRTEIC